MFIAFLVNTQWTTVRNQNKRRLTAMKNMVKKYTIASMWNCLLAAMLMVGTSARLLMVGKRIFANIEPIAMRYYGIIRDSNLCEAARGD